MAQGEQRPILGTFGVCLDMDGKDFDYWIADLYFPWEEIPEGCETRVIPASLWAQFPCTVETLQDANTKIWSQWLPALQGAGPDCQTVFCNALRLEDIKALSLSLRAKIKEN